MVKINIIKNMNLFSEWIDKYLIISINLDTIIIFFNSWLRVIKYNNFK